MGDVLSIWLVLILATSAILKVRRPAEAAGALATYGIAGDAAQRVTVWTLIAVELALGGALAAGVTWAAGVLTGLFVAFAVLTSTALLAGRAGRPCACFGSSSRLSWVSPVRALALAVASGALAHGGLPRAASTYDRWLTVGLSICVVALGALGLMVLALAREIGVLRLGAGSRGALEIPEEGPTVGSTQAWALAGPTDRRALLRLAIFTSEGCPMCRQVTPAIEHLAADPVLAVTILDEVSDAGVWKQAEIPGSPYAVALSLAGVTLAKGTFNSLGQLESIVGTARFREQGLSVAA
jgi:hypothetical protein